MRAVVFVASTPRFLAAAALARVFAFACVAALGAVPAHGVNSVGLRVPEPSDGMEHDASAKAPELGVRAIQINRCPDGHGGLRLQDRPCPPVETPVAGVAAAASAAPGQGDAIDLSALPPRATAAGFVPTSPNAADGEKPSLLRSMRDGALRLVAFAVALYLMWRLARWLPAWLGQRLPTNAEPPPDARRYGRPAPRPRAVSRRPERRRGSRWRRSS